jgi:hypothetical protein
MVFITFSSSIWSVVYTHGTMIHLFLLEGATMFFFTIIVSLLGYIKGPQLAARHSNRFLWLEGGGGVWSRDAPAKFVRRHFVLVGIVAGRC